MSNILCVVGPLEVQIDAKRLIVTPGADTNIKCHTKYSSQTDWYHGNKVITSSDKYSVTSDRDAISGVRTLTLLIRNVTDTDIGLYVCKASNGQDTVQDQI
eukprot:GHVU01101286.1.p1 GENE.GHVU01101286.1~~GHVU01101286.1.p1  ORF type:complete len:101 (+),score=7.48 GHVU01101286.1:15-317(+)